MAGYSDCRSCAQQKHKLYLLLHFHGVGQENSWSLPYRPSTAHKTKAKEQGYKVVRRILPIPSWATIKQYGQAKSTASPISQDNLTLMVQEMTRKGCKSIGGIHWDEMAIKEGILLCKRTGELVGFEDLNISPELTTEPENLNDNEDDDSDSFSESSDSQFSSAS